MKKLERRAILCLVVSLALIVGIVFFVYEFITMGGSWAIFYGNQGVYKNGVLTLGEVVDRKGLTLLENTKDGPIYNDDWQLRTANYHITGDSKGNVSTAVNVAMKDILAGYNPITGTSGLINVGKFSDKDRGKKLKLTIDARANEVAYEALGGKDGLVCVYDWKTGKIVVLVSAPSTDPKTAAGSIGTGQKSTTGAAAKSDSSGNGGSVREGTYIQKALSSSMTPGSTFKVVSSIAAIEKIEDIDSWTYTCKGKEKIGDEYITCPYNHGTVDFYGAMAKSCNCAYGLLSQEIGKDAFKSYVEKLGLTSSYDIDGILTKKGSFEFTDGIELAWAAIGQGKDQVNPISLMVLMGAIAGEGSCKSPVIIDERMLKSHEGKDITLLDTQTAKKIKDMMRNNVITNYGDKNYPNLELCAKSGTAEVSGIPNSWFCGFSGDYAFVVVVEKGGYGSKTAGPVANTVLQYLKK